MREMKTTARTKNKIKVCRQRRRLLFAFLCLLISIISLCSGFIVNADTEAGSHRYKYYTDIEIKAGDSMWDIALRYMTEEYSSPEQYIREVAQINDLSDPDHIYDGQHIAVPYYSALLK